MLKKIWNLLSADQRRGAVVLLGLILVGMAVETLGLGLVIPAMVMLTQRDIAAIYPSLQPAIRALGNPDSDGIVVAGLALLVGIYLVKEIGRASCRERVCLAV